MKGWIWRTRRWNAVDDLDGLLIEDIPGMWINDKNHEICWCDKGLVSASEKFMFDQGRDVLGLDSLMDESRGSEPCIGLNRDTILVEILENQMGAKIVEGDGDVGWQRQMRYTGYGMLGDANAGSCYVAGWRCMDT